MGEVARGVVPLAELVWRAILKSIAKAFDEPAAALEGVDSRHPPAEGDGETSGTTASDVVEARSREGE